MLNLSSISPRYHLKEHVVYILVCGAVVPPQMTQ